MTTGSFNGCGTAKENQTTSDFNNKRTGARVTPSNEESATTAALISACSQHLSPSISAAPVRTPDLVSSATQLHGSMAEPGGVDSLVGGCAMGGTHQEQLTRRDWQYGQYTRQFSKHQLIDLHRTSECIQCGGFL
jgi:hypothetical protein